MHAVVLFHAHEAGFHGWGNDGMEALGDLTRAMGRLPSEKVVVEPVVLGDPPFDALIIEEIPDAKTHQKIL